ncbi:hypothetical protein F4810DRAFT_673382 [Camillea tinctor]|nr:hypothetical protein F4810DRAFT_673382 [Camillea tinctor]
MNQQLNKANWINGACIIDAERTRKGGTNKRLPHRALKSRIGNPKKRKKKSKVSTLYDAAYTYFIHDIYHISSTNLPTHPYIHINSPVYTTYPIPPLLSLLINVVLFLFYPILPHYYFYLIFSTYSSICYLFWYLSKE